MTGFFPPVDVARFHSGDERLFAELVRTYSPRLAAQLRRYAGSESDVADMLQDVWLRAFQKRKSFDGRGSLFGWLLTICRTVGLAAISRAPTEQLAEHHAAATATEASIHTRLEHARVLRAVETLPDRQREVVLLRIVEGRSTAEAARMLQCAEGTIKASLHAAVHKLQQTLKERV
ncbi:MAG TPA: RNA polymerase sigma factor [Longimicrobiales bacterium]